MKLVSDNGQWRVYQKACKACHSTGFVTWRHPKLGIVGYNPCPNRCRIHVKADEDPYEETKAQLSTVPRLKV